MAFDITDAQSKQKTFLFSSFYNNVMSDALHIYFVVYSLLSNRTFAIDVGYFLSALLETSTQ